MPQSFLFLPYKPDRRASILIISLWAFATLSILSLAVANFVFQQIRFANSYIRSTLSLPMAKSEVTLTFLRRQNDETPDYDSFAELSQEHQQTLCDNLNYNYYYVDEGALININLASEALIARLPGLNEELAKKISESERRPFKLKEEILLVEGMNKDIFNQFKDLITVYGEGKININLVSSEVLSVLGLDSDLIDAIMSFRNEYIGPDGKQGTEDDGAFTNAGTILSDLRKFRSLTTEQEQQLLSIMSYLVVKSDYLRLNIIPQIKGKPGIHYSILLHPVDKKILFWQEF
ncbi:MAG: helix-hairpin-helix domain-containing protein [Candidatus Omnitrophica bacterium]|nr:helix-hairpin-helix domain-containing protein [Candidatus Omnitrophota bacterium]